MFRRILIPTDLTDRTICAVIVTRASVPHAQVDAHVVFGRRVEETLNFSRARQVDLIVLASHPIDPAEPASSMGTRSDKLGILAPCAVLLVK